MRSGTGDTLAPKNGIPACSRGRGWRKVLVLAGLAPFAVCGACGEVQSLPSDNDGDRAATSTPQAASEGSGASVTHTATPSESAAEASSNSDAESDAPTKTPRTPTSTTQRQRTPAQEFTFKGSAVCSDSVGDTGDGDGTAPPDPIPGLDLQAVRLEADGNSLKVAFDAVGPIPSDSSVLGSEFDAYFWGASIVYEDRTLYTISAELIRANWYAAIFDFVASKSFDLVGPVVDGQTLTVTVPRSRLARLKGPFQWTADTEWGDPLFYGDSCPDDAYPIGDALIAFPGP